MNKHLIKWSLFAMTSIFCACDKSDDDPQPPPVVTYPDFARLQVGNYWIYERFTIEPNGLVTSQNIFDSCYIEKDTLINNIVYHKMVRPHYSNGYPDLVYLLRDSLHYVVNAGGNILFSSVDFGTIFDSGTIAVNNADTICDWEFKMSGPVVNVTVPVGTFSTIEAVKTYYFRPNWASNGNPRYMHTRYALNMGIVVESLPFYTSIPFYYERRLIRYHLN